MKHPAPAPGAANPLAGLDRVRWDRLEHAFGPAGNLPALLRSLLSDSEDSREEARYWLANSLQHQGAVFSASAAAVPFLVRLASAPKVAGRGWILRFLTFLAVSRPNDWMWSGFDITHPEMTEYFEGGAETEPFRKCYEAVEGALPALLGLLSDRDPSVRTHAAFTCSFFARSAEKVSEAFRAALAKESEPLVLGSLLLGLGLQDNYLDSAQSQGLMLPYLTHPAPLNWVAAAALSYGSGPGSDPHPAALPLLLTALSDPATSSEWPGFPWFASDTVPWGDGNVLRLALTHLFKHVPPTDGPGTEAITQSIQDLYFTLVERVSEDSSPVELELAEGALRPLFRLATPAPPPESGWTLGTLRPSLRRFAEAVARRPFLLSGPLFEILKENGLPDAWEPLREFLEIREVGPLDLPIALGSRTQPLKDWIKEQDPALLLPLALAGAQVEAPVALAIAVITHQGGTVVGDYEGMRISFAEEDQAGQYERAVAVAILEGAVAKAPQAAEAEAIQWAERFARRGPPRSYRGLSLAHAESAVTHHPEALTLLCRAARLICAETGQLPKPVFDAMAQGELANEEAWDELQMYFELLPESRRDAFFLELANRDFCATWDPSFPLGAEDVLDRILPLVSARTRSLLEELLSGAGAELPE